MRKRMRWWKPRGDRATKPKDVETAVRLQIFLDQKRFGPGFIDGKPGKFTTKAVHAYNRSVGRVPDDWTAVIEEMNKELGETYATAIVPEVAKEWVNPGLPHKYEEQANEKRLGYRSYLEFMAERYHTSESFLVELNGSKKAYGIQPRSAIKVPNVDPFLIEKLAEGRTHKEDETLSARTVVIDTTGRNLFIYERGEAPKVPGAAVVVSEKNEEDFEPKKLIAMFPITPGKVQYIHRGEWAVANCFELPSWRYDKQLLETGVRSKDKSKVFQIPPGPNVPVGILWSGLTKSGIGIHGKRRVHARSGVRSVRAVSGSPTGMRRVSRNSCGPGRRWSFVRCPVSEDLPQPRHHSRICAGTASRSEELGLD